MKLTIGIPTHSNYAEVWFTVQALRLYHDLTDCEILIVDNANCEHTKTFAEKHGKGLIRYVRENSVQGTAYAKNKVFEHALGDVVLCIDSHVLLAPGAIESIQPTDDLITGPLLLSGQNAYHNEMLPVWRGGMWGIWDGTIKDLPKEKRVIWGMGCGCFYTNRKSWLKYNEEFRGFGGEEGYIHEKYRQAGRKVICDPALVWHHYFRPDMSSVKYPLLLKDKARNYMIGMGELGLPLDDVYKEFGERFCKVAENII